MVVFTQKCMCATMIGEGFQPQTYACTWCIMCWRTRCGRGVRYIFAGCNGGGGRGWPTLRTRLQLLSTCKRKFEQDQMFDVLSLTLGPQIWF